MKMGQDVRTGLGHGASPVSYRHNFLVYLFIYVFLLMKYPVKQNKSHKHITQDFESGTLSAA